MRKGKKDNGAPCGPLVFRGGLEGECCLWEGSSEYALKMGREDLNNERLLQHDDRTICSKLCRVSITAHT
jgi:hypothetical protein